MKTCLLGLLKGYRYWVSPWLGNRCRFYPSCSEYASEALQQHGLWHGSRLMLWRISRCHPWQEGGVDLVPTVEDRVADRCSNKAQECNKTTHKKLKPD